AKTCHLGEEVLRKEGGSQFCNVFNLPKPCKCQIVRKLLPGWRTSAQSAGGNDTGARW
ncbi:hypothetical protein EVAR_64321_1, partial [Eumeta japonica]